MGLFERSQEVRQEIEKTPTLIKRLEIYSKISNPFHCYNDPQYLDSGLNYISEGTEHVHFRLGRLESGLWLAIRDNPFGRDNKKQRIVYENYARDMEKYNQEGVLTPEAIIGVGINRPKPFYFLIVEDLTHGGTRHLKGAMQGEEIGTIDGVPVFHDSPQYSVLEGDFRFMHDNALIHLR